ncbi:cation:proton antiporter regulatory subunit [Streptomyces sp. NBC_00388]|uniref:cation:proton antiporter regulatory subunit n=1 Tax=Streptomyces sp. NBC_00388 TaxID=2975735 RepID=UPI002E1C1B67
MEPAARIRKTGLPGVGTRYDLNTETGQHISVVAHQDGRRILAFHDPEDDDSCRSSTPLATHEAAALSRLLTPPVAQLHEHLEIDLVSECIAITKRSPYAGRVLGATQARTRTGASIVAVLRRTTAFPSPTPDFRFASGDILVVVGTREGVDAVAELITGG